MKDQWLKPSLVADLFGISKDELWDRVQRGAIPAPINGRFRKADVDAWLDAMNQARAIS